MHALEYALGHVAHTPHGLGCGLLLPYAMRFNGPVRIPRMSRIAALLGEDISGVAEDTASMRAIKAVERLKADIGIPAQMSDVGVKQEQLPAMAEIAFAVKRILRVNPRPVTQKNLEAILSEAF